MANPSEGEPRRESTSPPCETAVEAAKHYSQLNQARKYEYQIGPDGESILPQELNGIITEIASIPTERPVEYRIRLDTGVVIRLPLVASVTIYHLQSGDFCKIAPSEAKTAEDAKRVQVLRNEKDHLAFHVANEYLYLE